MVCAGIAESAVAARMALFVVMSVNCFKDRAWMNVVTGGL